MTRSSSGYLIALMVAGAILPVSALASPLSDPGFGVRTVPAIPLDAAVMNGGLVVMRAHAETLSPAPLPDRDRNAPEASADTLSAQSDPTLTPGFISPSARFAGDGYASGSSMENDHSHRHSTGGLMSLSIPMP